MFVHFYGRTHNLISQFCEIALGQIHSWMIKTEDTAKAKNSISSFVYLLCSFVVILVLIYFTSTVTDFGDVEFGFDTDFSFVSSTYFFDESIDRFVFYQ